VRVPAWVSFAACTLIWGTTWLGIKLSYKGIEPFWGASLRFFLAGPLLLAGFALRRPARPPRGFELALGAFVGVLLFGIDYGLIYWAEQHIPSGLTAVLFATMPLFVALIAAPVLPDERFGFGHAAGIALGIGGLVIVFRDQLGFEASDLLPMLAVVGAALAGAVSAVVMRRFGRHADAYFLNGSAMLVGALVLLSLSLMHDERPALPHGAVAWLATAYLALFGSVVGFLLYFRMLHSWGANRSSLITLLTPVVALGVSGVMGERVTLEQLLGTALVLAGVAVSIWWRPAPSRP